MYSKIKIFGHPIHPMLVAYPIAFYTSTLVGFIIYGATSNFSGATVILQAVHEAASVLLHSTSWETDIVAVLGRLGAAVPACRAFLLEIEPVLQPRDPVHPRRRIPLEPGIGILE